MSKKKDKKPKLRNPYALHATTRKAVKFKDKRAPRGGSRNKQKDILNREDE